MSFAPPHFEPVSDLSVCAQEPIHIPGLIEPNGVLLVVSEPELTIVQVSANMDLWLERNAEELLNVPLGDLLEHESLESLRLGVSTDHPHGQRQYRSDMRIRGLKQTFDASVHRHQGVLIIELEPTVVQAHVALHSSLADAMSSLNGRLSLTDLCQRVTIH